ncbi:MAG: lipoprotein-releasing system ATP-binding protein LolD [Crocinitomicaceae bacterium]|nr:MAG: lipoprotein-releasing system ATP-binding protein LolD [Crocinitomicaceae bacterium]
MIQTSKLTKHYGELEVLKGIDLSINEKEIVSIVGKSGAGKTTLLQLIGTLEKPTSGFVSIEGKDLSKFKEKELAKFRNQSIGFVFQFHHLLPEFTALENTCLPGYIAKKNKKDSIERAKFLLHTLGLNKRINHRPSELSGGEQQRVSIARALMNEPKVILADEPSGNLDTKTADEIHNLFFKLREELGLTFVIVTHNIKIAELADRKIVMKDGLIIPIKRRTRHSPVAFDFRLTIELVS